MLGIDLLSKVVKGEITEGKYKFYIQCQKPVECIVEIKNKYLYVYERKINSFLSSEDFEKFLSSEVKEFKEFKHISEENLKVIEAWVNDPYKYYISDGTYTYGKTSVKQGFLENDVFNYGISFNTLLNKSLELKEFDKDEE